MSDSSSDQSYLSVKDPLLPNQKEIMPPESELDYTDDNDDGNDYEQLVQ